MIFWLYTLYPLQQKVLLKIEIKDITIYNTKKNNVGLRLNKHASPQMVSFFLIWWERGVKISNLRKMTSPLFNLKGKKAHLQKIKFLDILFDSCYQINLNVLNTLLSSN